MLSGEVGSTGQDLVDAKLERRKKGVFGPPMGRTCVVMVDDLNMPVKDVSLHNSWMLEGWVV